jgi:hypothetical protein
VLDYPASSLLAAGCSRGGGGDGRLSPDQAQKGVFEERAGKVSRPFSFSIGL